MLENSKKYQVLESGVEHDDGRGSLRDSNARPAPVLRFEARTEAGLAETRETVESASGEVTAEIG